MVNVQKAVQNFVKANVPPLHFKPPADHHTVMEPVIIPVIFKPIFRAIERFGVHFYNNALSKTRFGLYNKDWNPRVHGPYLRHRYYGTNRDIPFMEVKLCDLRAYFSRRDMSFRAIYNEFMRNFWRVHYEFYSGPKYASVIQTIARFVFFNLFVLWAYRLWYGSDDHWRHSIYHW